MSQFPAALASLQVQRVWVFFSPSYEEGGHSAKCRAVGGRQRQALCREKLQSLLLPWPCSLAIVAKIVLTAGKYNEAVEMGSHHVAAGDLAGGHGWVAGLLPVRGLMSTLGRR